MEEERKKQKNQEKARVWRNREKEKKKKNQEKARISEGMEEETNQIRKTKNKCEIVEERG